MKEILGAELDKAFEELKQAHNITATKTYETKKTHYEYQEKFQVWEMSNEEYDKLCNIKDPEWNDDWGWWRGAEGSNMGTVHKRYKINHHYIKAWDGTRREDYAEENKKLPPEDRWYQDREYSYLTQYFCDELGASTERNLCALSVDLAAQNGMKMSELFRKFQG